MKKFLMSVVVCMFVVGVTSSVGAMVMIGDPLEGNSWGQIAMTEHQPNLVNLWSTEPFEYAIYPIGTNYWQSSDGYWAQWFTTEDYGDTDVVGIQWWVGDKETPLNLDVQECWYDWDTNTIEASWNKGHYWDGSWWSSATYGSAGGLVDCPPPVPIPTSVLLLGAGLFGLIGIGYRRRKSTAE